MDSKTTEILLKEYETCNSAVAGIDSRMWQFSAVISLIGAAIAGAVLGSKQFGSGGVDIAIVVGGLSLAALSLTWLANFRRNQSVRLIIFFRMREIEDQLGMRRNFYIHAWDITNDDRSDTYLDTFDESRVNSKLSKEDKTRLLNFFRELGRFGNVHKLLGMLRFDSFIRIPGILGLVLGVGIVAFELVNISVRS